MVSISQWPLPPTANAGLELAVRHVDHDSETKSLPPRPPLYSHSPNDSYTTSFHGEHPEKAILERTAEPVSVFDTERKICGVRRRTFLIFLAVGLGLVIVIAVVGSVAAVVSSKANKSAESATSASSTSAVQISTSHTSLPSSHTSSVAWTSSQILPQTTPSAPTSIIESTSIITPTPSPAEPVPTSILADSSTPIPAPAATTTPQAESPTSQAPLLVATDSAPVDPNATTVFAASVEVLTVTAPPPAATP